MIPYGVVMKIKKEHAEQWNLVDQATNRTIFQQLCFFQDLLQFMVVRYTETPLVSHTNFILKLRETEIIL